MNEERRYRVLQLCSSSTTSGAERHVLHLSQRLTQRGHFVQAVNPEPGWLPSELSKSGIPTKVSHMKGQGWLRTAMLIAREVRRNKIDVVHTHLTRAAYIGHAIGLLSRVPIVTSVHIANNDQIYRRLARRKNRLVAVSNFVAGMLHGKGVPDKFIDTVYNGTDFNELEGPSISANDFGAPEGRRLIGLVGRVCREKGHLEMITAMKDVKAMHSDAHVVFVGRVEALFEPEIKAAIAQAELENHVSFAGLRHDIPQVIDNFTLSAMPSHIETFGVAAIEAMARGKAVVASNVGGLPEVVRHKQTGLLVDLRPPELADAINFLLSNDDIREEMGRNGKLVVEQKFTLTEMTRRFESVYANAVG